MYSSSPSCHALDLLKIKTINIIFCPEVLIIQADYFLFVITQRSPYPTAQLSFNCTSPRCFGEIVLSLFAVKLHPSQGVILYISHLLSWQFCGHGFPESVTQSTSYHHFVYGLWYCWCYTWNNNIIISCKPQKIFRASNHGYDKYFASFKVKFDNLVIRAEMVERRNA
jgi:hypothetical protein